MAKKRLKNVSELRRRSRADKSLQERTTHLIRAVESGEINGLEKETDAAAGLGAALREHVLEGKETDFDVLADFLRSEDERTRSAAAACVRHQAQQTSTSLKSMTGVKLYSNPKTRSVFFAAIGDQKQPSGVRRDLLRALPILRFSNKYESLPVLLTLLDESFPADLLEAAIDALKWCGPDLASASTKHLDGLLKHQSSDVRIRTCQTLEWLGLDGKLAIPRLIEYACDDESPNVRLRAAAALVAIDPAGDQLEKVLNETRRIALIHELRNLEEDGRPLRRQLEEVKIESGEWSPETVPTPAQSNVFRCDGKYRTITFAGRTVTVKDLAGYFHIDQLLREPSTELDVLELRQRYTAWTARGKRNIDPSGAGSNSSNELASPPGNAGDAVDIGALHNYQTRLDVLKRKEADAKERGNGEEAVELQDEIALLEKSIRRNSDHRGRPRPISPESKKSRDSVNNAINRVLEELKSVHPSFYSHLSAYMKIGPKCRYNPPGPVEWET